MPDAETTERLYWQAAPHRWGEGKLHLVEDRQRTLCGKPLETCPGRYVAQAAVTCQGCLNALQARVERETREAEWRARQGALRLEREQKDQAWQARYRAYLLSPAWAAKRAKVLRREGHLCEACRARQATQAHHSTYKHVFHEPLFELRAICKECHERLTELDQLARNGIKYD